MYKMNQMCSSHRFSSDAYIRNSYMVTCFITFDDLSDHALIPIPLLLNIFFINKLDTDHCDNVK